MRTANFSISEEGVFAQPPTPDADSDMMGGGVCPAPWM